MTRDSDCCCSSYDCQEKHKLNDTLKNRMMTPSTTKSTATKAMAAPTPLSVSVTPISLFFDSSSRSSTDPPYSPPVDKRMLIQLQQQHLSPSEKEELLWREARWKSHTKSKESKDGCCPPTTTDDNADRNQDATIKSAADTACTHYVGQKDGSSGSSNDSGSESGNAGQQQTETTAPTTQPAATTTTTNTATTKRQDYLSWDDYFFAVAALSAKRSKDPQHPTGACIVDWNKRVVGISYNGFPRGCPDDCLPWTTTTAVENSNNQQSLHDKSFFVVHAPVNAILNKCSADVAGSTLYCQRFPCHECAKVIIQSRIAHVVYLSDASCCCDDHSNAEDQDSLRASRIMFSMAGVQLRKYTPIQSTVQLFFREPKEREDHRNLNKELGILQSLEDVNVNSYVLFSAPDNIDKNGPVSEFRDMLIREANYDPLVHPSTKRCGTLSWDDYFLAMALLTAQRSKDPNTQVGACIVDSNRRIIGLGYNGFPVGCSDDDLPWARHSDISPLHTKYLYVCHAEVNAILNKGSADVRGATLYVALFPCNECAKQICQAGIAEVVYMNDQYHDTDSCRASRIMFEMAGVKLRQHIPGMPNLNIPIVSSVHNK